MAPNDQPQPKPRRLFPLVLTGLIVALALFVMRTSLSGEGTFNLSVAQLSQSQDDYEGKQVKVEGTIKKGSVHTGKNEFDIYFDVHDSEGNTVSVHYSKALPDPFKEGRTAIVEGVLTAKGMIEASRLTVKCPSKYKSKDMKPEEWERYQRENPEHLSPNS